MDVHDDEGEISNVNEITNNDIERNEALNDDEELQEHENNLEDMHWVPLATAHNQ